MAAQMILAIAERVNDPRMDAERVARWARVWREHRLRAMLTTPAMSIGQTKSRFAALTGLPIRTKVINLMPPDNKIWTWDAGVAEMQADYLREWLREDACLTVFQDNEQCAQERVTGVVLLGRRVATAWQMGWYKFGTITAIAGCQQPFLLLPHPSGRNRTWNDPALVASLRQQVVKFQKLAGVQQCQTSTIT